MTENPFTAIMEKMDRMESMIAELNQKLESRQEESTDNGIDMAMRITGYTKATIYKLVNLRKIPHAKRRGFLVFDEDELKDWAKGKSRPISSSPSSVASRYSQSR
jgi:predicted DNA-binding transcriptional regulator AlpA